MTRDEIILRVTELSRRREVHWKDDQKLHHFAAKIQDVSDDVVFDALISFFHSLPASNHKFNEQECAGTLLALRRPSPETELDRIICETLGYWDVSVEQLPWYLALVFGREKFREAVRRLQRDEHLSKREAGALDTFLYWTVVSEARMVEELQLNQDI